MVLDAFDFITSHYNVGPDLTHCILEVLVEATGNSYLAVGWIPLDTGIISLICIQQFFDVDVRLVHRLGLSAALQVLAVGLTALLVDIIA